MFSFYWLNSFFSYIKHSFYSEFMLKIFSTQVKIMRKWEEIKLWKLSCDHEKTRPNNNAYSLNSVIFLLKWYNLL